jgi:hypothetical protein
VFASLEHVSLNSMLGSDSKNALKKLDIQCKLTCYNCFMLNYIVFTYVSDAAAQFLLNHLPDVFDDLQ